MIYLLLPAYNEEKSIGGLIERVINLKKNSNLCFSILAVDDGSTDDTAKTLNYFKNDIPIEIISHKENKGLGEALKYGILYLLPKLNDNDIVVTMDADNTHDPSLIPIMVDKICKGYDVIIASRFKEGGKEIGVPDIRKFFSKSAKLIFTLLFPISNVRDYTSGYRAYKYTILKKSFDKYGSDLIEESGFVCMVELLLKLRKFGAIMNEVPLILRYDFKKGKSKMKVIRTILRYFYIISLFKLGLL